MEHFIAAPGYLLYKATICCFLPGFEENHLLLIAFVIWQENDERFEEYTFQTNVISLPNKGMEKGRTK
ncbi:hypothetical protein D0466_05175 [Peribacillus glennii]|uniref:Uncharacterized protein n=1 Tax=Peribacillus glennii TaxID=2303991 RepID=A0A372LG58_9BACI|nr:hypothetical protein D0466_05175 [Peribacillus glennii]